LAPDFLLLLDMMKYYQEHTYTEVDILSLGTYLRKFNSKSRGRKNHADGGAGAASLSHRSLKSLNHRTDRHLLWAPSFFDSLRNMIHQVSLGPTSMFLLSY